MAGHLNPASPDTPGLTSSRGRIVKPKVWEDGTEAVPAVGLRGQARPVHKEKEKEKQRDKEQARSESSHEPASAHRSSERNKWRPNYATSLAKRGSVPIRDETGRFIGVRPKTAAERLQRQTAGSGGIFKSAAVQVLRLEKRLMATGDIAKVALQRGLIKCQGKTPEATMASALYTDVKRKEGHSIFIRPHEGLFGLREWADKGLVFKVTMTTSTVWTTHHSVIPAPDGDYTFNTLCVCQDVQVMDDDEHYVDDPNNPQYQHCGGEYAYQAGHSGEDFEGDGFQAEHVGYEASDGDIYGSEGAYMRYEEGAGEGSDPYDQDVSSGRRHYQGRHSSARPAHSYGGYTDDDMDDDAYVTPETNPPLQVRDAVSGGRPGRSGGRARSSGAQQAHSRMSPATDEENSNIMLLLDAAEELHKTASQDAPEPSTAATHGAITSADAVGAQKDDAAYPPSKHARTSKEQTTPKGNKAGKGGQGAKGGAKGVGTRGKAKMLADESRFSRPHPLQVPAAGAAAKRNQGNAGEHSDGIPTPPLPHHASFPETAAELVLDLTIAGHNAASSSTAHTGFGDRASPLGQDQVNILNLPLPDFDSMSGTNESYPEERPEDMDPDEPDGITSPPEASAPRDPNVAPPGAVTKSRLQNLEQNLLVLERTYGATHPQVGKAWLLLSKIYQSNPAAASQVMAEAALVRSWEVYALCQGAAQPEDLTPATVQSFSHLLEKIQRNPEKMANAITPAQQHHRQQQLWQQQQRIQLQRQIQQQKMLQGAAQAYAQSQQMQHQMFGQGQLQPQALGGSLAPYGGQWQAAAYGSKGLPSGGLMGLQQQQQSSAAPLQQQQSSLAGLQQQPSGAAPVQQQQSSLAALQQQQGAGLQQSLQQPRSLQQASSLQQPSAVGLQQQQSMPQQLASLLNIQQQHAVPLQQQAVQLQPQQPAQQPQATTQQQQQPQPVQQQQQQQEQVSPQGSSAPPQ